MTLSRISLVPSLHGSRRGEQDSCRESGEKSSESPRGKTAVPEPGIELTLPASAHGIGSSTTLQLSCVTEKSPQATKHEPCLKLPQRAPASFRSVWRLRTIEGDWCHNAGCRFH